MPAISLACYLYFWLNDYESQVHMTPLLRSNYFARMAHRTQRNIYLPCNWYIVRGYHSVSAKCKSCIGLLEGKGHGASMPFQSTLLSSKYHLPGSSLNSFLLNFYMGFITQAWLINHWPLRINSISSHFPLPEGSNPLITRLVLLTTEKNKSLGGAKKSLHQHNK